MTELSFLLDLLLNHKLPKVTRDAVAARIKEVEAIFISPGYIPNFAPIRSTGSNQAPSMQAIMARNPDLMVAPAPEKVEIVAQTPAAVAALNSRQQAIAESMAGKVNKETGRPRKF